MAITISDIRDRVADQPRNYGVQPETPKACGVADGFSLMFYLPLGKASYVTGSAQLYYNAPNAAIGTAPTPIVNSGNSAYTISTQGVVTFVVAPGQASGPASPIPVGSSIVASFQGTAFSDTHLTGVLTRNVAKYSADDMALCGCQIEIIDALLMDTDKMAMTRESEYQKNPAYVVKSLTDLLDKLKTQIEEDPRPGKDVPFMMAVQTPIPRYQIRR